MSDWLRRHAPLAYACFAMLALYTPWINRGFINLEWGVALAARGLHTSDDFRFLQAYFDSGNANPLGYPFLLAIIYRLGLPVDAFWTTRIPSIVGTLLILIWGYKYSKITDKDETKIFYLWATTLVLHPMIFSFSTSTTSDITGPAFFLISISLLSSYFLSQRSKFALSSGIALGFSTCIKYLTPFFGMSFAYIFFALKSNREFKKSKLLRDFGVFVVAAGLVLLFEIAWKWSNTGIFLTIGNDQVKPNFLDVVSWLKTLGKYLSFLGLFCGFLPIVYIKSVKERLGSPLIRSAFIAAVLSLGWFFSRPLSEGELDFGGGFPLGEQAARVIQTYGFLNAVILVFVLVKSWQANRDLDRAYIFGLIPFLVLISAARPTQRYLMYAIPIVLMLLIKEMNSISIRLRWLVLALNLFGFSLISLFGMSYLTSQGNASEEMAVWVEDNNLISQTSAGAISPHAGQHFWGVEKTELRYEIIAVAPSAESGIKERVLHREPMKVLGRVTRVYLLREIPLAP